MSVRLQTWFPFELQIAINGREWLRRSLDAAGCKYLKQGNKFLDIADYPLAQHLLDTQLDTQWKEMLAAFLPEVFPTMPQTLSRAPNLWADDNSVKLYNEQNVLRVEMTMNRPDRFEVFSHKEGRQDAPKQRLPLRKGVADIPLRAQVAADVNKRFTAHLATLKDETPVMQLFAEFRAHMHEGRQVRALDPLGKDLALLQAI